jgi:DNA-directed RNA polymerase specialized sigma24 family protein
MGEDRSREDLTLSRDAFMTRVESVLDPAYRLASVVLLDDRAAEDAVHAATMIAWRRFRRARGEVTNFRTWFLAIVVDRCRRVRLLRPFGSRGRSQRLVRPGGLPDAIRRLPVRTRAALFCFFFLDLPLDEVAHVLRLTPARVRSQVYRGGEKLQPLLEDNGSPAS